MNVPIHQLFVTEPAPIRYDDALLELAPPAPLLAEQLQATDQFFQCEEETTATAGLLALWGGAMLLGDLAVEHLSGTLDLDEDEVEEELS